MHMMNPPAGPQNRWGSLLQWRDDLRPWQRQLLLLLPQTKEKVGILILLGACLFPGQDHCSNQFERKI